MKSKISLSLAPIGLLIGLKGVAVPLDGEKQTTIQPGETLELDVEPGERTVQTVLEGGVPRRSKVLRIQIAPNSDYVVAAKYSRLWGNIKLKSENQ